MRPKITIPTRILLAVLLYGFHFAYSQDRPGVPDNSDGIFKASWSNFRKNQEAARIVLAVANGPSSEVRIPSGENRFVVKARVLHEFRNSLTEGSTITIRLPAKTGARTGGRFYLSFRGDQGWTAGLVFIMPLWATGEQGEFEAAGNTSLLGVDMPYEVGREDIPLIKAAMDKLGEIAKRVGLMMTRQEATLLMDSHVKDNYYLWSLGATGTAVQNDKAAADELYGRWFPDKQSLPSPREIVWLDHCFGDVMSDGVGPDRARRHDMLIDYLKRLSDAMPTTVPSRPAHP